MIEFRLNLEPVRTVKGWTEVWISNGDSGEQHWRIRLAWFLRRLADRIEGCGRRSWAFGLYSSTEISSQEKQQIIRACLEDRCSDLLSDINRANVADIAAREAINEDHQ